MHKLILTIALIAGAVISSQSACTVRLSLDEAIRMAGDSSLQAFMNQNLYMSGVWEYRAYRAARLPSLSLDLTPASYNRYITQRYNFEDNIDIFRAQQLFSASGSLSIMQNFDPLGGSFYLETSLEFMRNFGENRSSQFTSIPIRLGYRQSIIGFNPFKWDRRIEPLKYEKVKKEFLYNMELLAEQAVEYFFQLALAQMEYSLAADNLASCDTLCAMGERKYKIANISQADLLTLRLDKVNARTSLENARIAIKKTSFALASFLGLPDETLLETILPEAPPFINIPPLDALAYAKENNPEIIKDKFSILEARKEVNRAKIESMLNADINASVGFNQVAGSFTGAYRHPMRQDLVSVSVSFPLLDWGVRKGKLNMARNNLNVQIISARQKENALEQDILITLDDFNIQQELLKSARDAVELADMAYTQTQQRFLIGKTDLNSLTLSLNRRQEASRNYVNALKNHWLLYYKIRKLTLYDFSLGQPIGRIFDFKHGL